MNFVSIEGGVYNVSNRDFSGGTVYNFGVKIKEGFQNCTLWNPSERAIKLLGMKGVILSIQGVLEDASYEKDGKRVNAISINVKDISALKTFDEAREEAQVRKATFAARSGGGTATKTQQKTATQETGEEPPLF